MSMEKIKVIIKRPDEDGHVAWISNTLDNLQRTVDGFIETITIARDLVIICNEEGRIKHLEPNCSIAGVSFVGTIILAGIKGEEFGDIPDSITLKFFKQRLVHQFHEGYWDLVCANPTNE